MWFVAGDGDSAEGPHLGRELAQLVASGALPAGVNVCEVGGTTWVRWVDVVAPTRAPKSRWRPGPRAVRWAVGALACALAVAAAFVVAKRVRPTTIFTLDARRLPSGVTSVERIRFADSQTLLTLSPALLTSLLADSSACEGSDIARRLMAAKGQTLDEIRSGGLVRDLSLPSTKDGLACGQRIAQTLEDSPIFEIRFEQGGVSGMVEMLPGRTEGVNFGTHFIRHSFSGLSGLCRASDDGTACKDGGYAVLLEPNAYFFGRLEALSAFARTYAGEHEELSTNLDILATLSRTADAESDVVSMFARPSRVLSDVSCREAAPNARHDEFVAACFPPGISATLDRILAKTRGFTKEHRGLARTSEVYFKLTFLARDDEEAEALERELQDLVRDWKSHLENHEAEIARINRDSALHGTPREKLWAATEQSFLRAHREMTLSRSGSAVALRIQHPLSDQEQREVLEIASARQEERQAAEQVVQQILSGSPLDAASLTPFFGGENAEWIAAPHATEETCTTFREKLDSLANADRSPAQFAIKFRIQRRFESSACVSQAMPTDMPQCVASANTLAALERCRFIDLPNVKRAKQAVVGKWVLDELGGTFHAFRIVFQNARFQFDAERVAVSALGITRVAQLDFVPVDSTAFLFNLPMESELVPLHLAPQTNGTLRLNAVNGNGYIALKRASFSDDLFSLAASSAVEGAY